MNSNLKQTVLKESKWLSLETLIHLNTKKYSIYDVKRWEDSNLLFCLTHEKITYYPAFAIRTDIDNMFAQIVMLMYTEKSYWNIAAWLASNNSYLNGHKPSELILKEPTWVLSACLQELHPSYHG